MDIEELAKRMRDRALTLNTEEAIAELAQQAQRKIEIQRAWDRLQKEVEEERKLYFHAGRWAGGARDKTAKQAYEEISKR